MWSSTTGSHCSPSTNTYPYGGVILVVLLLPMFAATVSERGEWHATWFIICPTRPRCGPTRKTKVELRDDRRAPRISNPTLNRWAAALVYLPSLSSSLFPSSSTLDDPTNSSQVYIPSLDPARRIPSFLFSFSPRSLLPSSQIRAACHQQQIFASHICHMLVSLFSPACP